MPWRSTWHNKDEKGSVTSGAFGTSRTAHNPTDRPIFDAVHSRRYLLGANAPPTNARERAASYVSDPDSLERVAEALTREDWAQARWLAMRLTTDGAARTDGMGIFLFNDPVLADHLRYLGDMLMDEIADGAATGEVPELFLSSIFGPRTGAGAAIAHAVISERLDDRKDVVKLAAMAVSDPGLRVQVTREMIAALDGPGDFSTLDSLMALPDVDDAMGGALLELRPSDTTTAQVQQELLVRHMNRAGWYPDEHNVLDAFRHMIETARNSSELGEFSLQDPHDLLSLILDGTVAECVERDMGRAAAIVSLCRLMLEPDDVEMIRRGIFESVRVSDWRLARRVLEVARWPAGPIDADRADRFHLSITTALWRLSGRDLARLVELGDACLRAVTGTPGEHTRRYAADRTEILTDRYESFESAADNAVTAAAGQAIWGVDDPETFGLGLAEDAEILEHHGHYVLSGQSVKQFAARASLVRRRGPGALLVLVDVIIESGDLKYARSLMDSLGEVYPLNSMVLEWRLKLAAHTSNDAQAAAVLGELRELWREDADDATPLAQVGVLERLVTKPAATDFVKERARRVALVPAFGTWADRLRSIADG
jgi:hypothetical protein